MLSLVKPNHLARYRQIVDVLTRHGLEHLVETMGLERFRSLAAGLVGRSRPPHPHTRPEHVRMALEELGTTFIKLGQILSTRADLLPADYRAELTKLQDSAPAVPFAEIEEVVVSELGQPIACLFAHFEREPLAAASIGQAHAANLPDGTEVVVKVRRPGVVEQVEQDLEILQNLAAAASRRWEWADRYDVVGLAQEFAQTLRAELDYIREGHSAERFAANFAREPAVHIPRIFWEATTSRVLTLERIFGTKSTDLAGLERAGLDRREVAERAARVVLKMVFEDGFFHADPHAGNFFIEADGRIGLIDFGMVGTVDERTRGQLVELLLAVASQDAERLVDALLELGLSRRRVDRHLLRQDVDHLVSRYYNRSLSDLAVGPLLEDVFAIVRRHHLRLPPNLVLLIKTALMAEGLGVQLHPDFSLPALLAPYAERFIRQQYSPLVWARRVGRASRDFAEMGVTLPVQARRLIGEIERGGLEVGMRPEGFEPLLGRLERLANRIVLGVLAAAFVVGLAVLLSAYRPDGWEQWAGGMFGVGFVLAVALGVYLTWTILRSGRA
jgi:ubiquinone biosynthesis protein